MYLCLYVCRPCTFSLQLGCSVVWMKSGPTSSQGHTTGPCGCIGVGVALWRKWGWGWRVCFEVSEAQATPSVSQFLLIHILSCGSLPLLHSISPSLHVCLVKPTSSSESSNLCQEVPPNLSCLVTWSFSALLNQARLNRDTSLQFAQIFHNTSEKEIFSLAVKLL